MIMLSCRRREPRTSRAGVDGEEERFRSPSALRRGADGLPTTIEDRCPGRGEVQEERRGSRGGRKKAWQPGCAPRRSPRGLRCRDHRDRRPIAIAPDPRALVGQCPSRGACARLLDGLDPHFSSEPPEVLPRVEDPHARGPARPHCWRRLPALGSLRIPRDDRGAGSARQGCRGGSP